MKELETVEIYGISIITNPELIKVNAIKRTKLIQIKEIKLNHAKQSFFDMPFKIIGMADQFILFLDPKGGLAKVLIHSVKINASANGFTNLDFWKRINAMPKIFVD